MFAKNLGLYLDSTKFTDNTLAKDSKTIKYYEEAVTLVIPRIHVDIDFPFKVFSITFNSFVPHFDLFREIRCFFKKKKKKKTYLDTYQ